MIRIERKNGETGFTFVTDDMMYKGERRTTLAAALADRDSWQLDRVVKEYDKIVALLSAEIEKRGIE